MFTDQKKFICQSIDDASEELWFISQTLFDSPETAFKEYKACKTLGDFLINKGYVLDLGVGNLETAFCARIGDKAKPTVAILAEYDALTGLGHACGHNLIAAAAMGAGAALAALEPELPGRILVIGTPAEEGGGGKILLAEAGIFNEVDAAMMFHPASKNLVLRTSLASSKLKLEFFGKASHAAAAPEEGINALDALILTFNNINSLRAILGPKDVIAGIIIKGGEAANIVPAYTCADFSIRSLTTKRRDEIIKRVMGCAEAGAKAIGTTVKCTVSPGYMEMIPNHVMANLFITNVESIGWKVEQPDPFERMGSTDMGDISHLLPAIHPYLAIAPENIAGHTLEFKEYAISEAGKSAMLAASKAMAMTVVDLLNNPGLLTQARQELVSYFNNS
jgi:amidohydrolase